MGVRSLLAGSAALTASIVLAGTGAQSVTVRLVADRSGAVQSGAVQSGAVRSGAVRSVAARFGATGAAGPQAPVHQGICLGPPGYRPLEARLSADISGALRGRSGEHAVTVFDRVSSVYCTLQGGRHFAAASIVKVIIAAALLRWHQETGTPLSENEKYLVALMITESDNDAATELWDELGLARLQHFLDLVKMGKTELGDDGYWGLTQVTAHDEMLLLELLARENPVLWDSSRSYELGLMADVVDREAWGVTAGTPAGVTWHVKNGWLPEDTGWHINSIGTFSGRGRDYMIAVLTDDNPSERYGIDTIENVARPVQRDINAAKPPRAPIRAWLAVSVAGTPADQSAPSPARVSAASPPPGSPARPSAPRPVPWAAVLAPPAPARG